MLIRNGLIFGGKKDMNSSVQYKFVSTKEFVDAYSDLLQMMTSGYLREGKRYVTVAIGCTGGQHRSVAIAEELSKQLSGSLKGASGEFVIEAHAVHRDVGRE